MSTKEMAEMLGSALVGLLVKKAASFLTGNYEMQAGVEDKLARLEELLVKIQTAVEVAEGRRTTNLWLLHWLRRLKDAAYDANVVLKTFDYRILERRANEDDGEVGSFFAFSSFNAAKRIRTAARNLFSCDDGVRELTSVVEKLERIAAGAGDFLKLLELDGSFKQSSLSRGRLRNMPEEPVGLNLLLQPEFLVLRTWGLRKTTFSHLVCKDNEGKSSISV